MSDSELDPDLLLGAFICLAIDKRGAEIGVA